LDLRPRLLAGPRRTGPTPRQASAEAEVFPGISAQWHAGPAVTVSPDRQDLVDAHRIAPEPDREAAAYRRHTRARPGDVSRPELLHGRCTGANTRTRFT
jgi:hypothetical protein